MATKQTITQALRNLAHLPNSPITKDNVAQLVDQYHLDLGDLPDNILEAAVIHYRTNETFFPGSGDLRKKATELLLISMNVPTAHQAWAQVISAVRYKDTVWCTECEKLFNDVEGKTGNEYWDAIHAYRKHTDSCEDYEKGGYAEVYDHPVVEQIVAEMGGRDRLVEGDISVSRSLFIRGYNEIVLQKTKLATMAAPVKDTVMKLQSASQIGLLADRMGK